LTLRAGAAARTGPSIPRGRPRAGDSHASTQLLRFGTTCRCRSASPKALGPDHRPSATGTLAALRGAVPCTSTARLWIIHRDHRCDQQRPALRSSRLEPLLCACWSPSSARDPTCGCVSTGRGRCCLSVMLADSRPPLPPPTIEYLGAIDDLLLSPVQIVLRARYPSWSAVGLGRVSCRWGGHSSPEKASLVPVPRCCCPMQVMASAASLPQSGLCSRNSIAN